MRNRLIISLLISGILLYYAVPHLVLQTNSLEGIFSLGWLGLAFIVISGNLIGLLYSPKNSREKQSIKKAKMNRPERMRQYQ